MDDLFRFVWRGALGGAIVQLFSSIRFLYSLYDSVFFWYFLFISFLLVVPGAVVGAILWFLCAWFVDRLGPLRRIMIGVTIASMMMALVWLCLLWVYSGDSYHDDLLNFPRMIRSSLSYGVSFGVLAGYFCPAATFDRIEPEPSYWERVRQYEAAQAEHDYWKAELASRRSREDKGSA